MFSNESRRSREEEVETQVFPKHHLGRFSMENKMEPDRATVIFNDLSAPIKEGYFDLLFSEVRGQVSVPKNDHLELEIAIEGEHAYYGVFFFFFGQR